MRRIDVTAAMQAWADGAPNFGLAILPQIISGNDDGIEIRSSENPNMILRPRLEVTYGVASSGADLDGDGTVGPSDVGLLLLDFGSCLGCLSDLDGSGEVNAGDLSFLLLLFD
jgi:hypothetical protein